MQLKNTKLRLNFIVAVILFLLTILGHFFADSLILASLMWPAFGFTSIFYYKFDKKVIFGILVGVFLGQMFNEIFLETGTNYIDILMRISFTVTTLLEAILFTTILRYLCTKFQKKNSLVIYAFLFVISGSIATFIGGMFSTTIINILFEDTLNFWYYSTRWMLGDFSGFIIFAPALLIIIDSKANYKKIINGQLIYHLIFLIFVIVLFYEIIPGFYYDELGYLLIVLYTIGALRFKYHFIIINNFILLVGYQLIYIRVTLIDFDSDSISQILLSLNLLLIVVSNLALLIVYFIEKNKKQKNEILIANEELSRLIESTHSLIEVSGGLLSKGKTLDEEDLGRIFSIATVIFSKFDGASCFITDDGFIKFIDSVNYNIEELNKIRIKTSKFKWNVNETVVNIFTEESLKLNLGEYYEKYSKQVPLIHNSINLYFKLSDNNIGGMSFDLFEDDNQYYSDSDIIVFDSFYKLISVLYENSKFFAEKDSFKSSIVFSLVKMLGIFDEYTYDHSTDVANISLEISKRLGMIEEKQFEVYWSGIIHDIGKIGIDSRIINKTTSLTEEEFNEVKKHPMLAYNILADNKDLADIAIVVKHHHEKFDGTGYPDHLKENEIPFESQILCVADAVSSMSTIRTYSNKKSIVEIRKELQKCSGSQFNPDIANIMIQMIDDGWLNSKYK